MKHLQTNKCSISVFLLIVFLSNIFLSGCHSVKKTTVLSSKEISSSKRKTNKKKYTYKIIQQPNINNQDCSLSIYQADQYNILTQDYVKQDLKVNFLYGAVISSVIITACLGGVKAARDTDPSGNKDVIGVGIGLLVAGALLYFPAMAIEKKKYRYKYIQGDLKQKFDEPYLVKNTSVKITNSNNSNNSKVFQTDEFGTLNFSPLADFKIDYSLYNLGEVFRLKTNNVNFEDALILKPSTWLSRFTKVTSSESIITQNASTHSSPIGIARKGLEYKILSEDVISNRFQIKLFLNKSGWISSKDVETYYAVEKKSDVYSAIKNYVEEKISEWQKQDEFELPDDYYRRMQNREEKVKELTYKAMELFQKDYKAMISWNDAAISRYDPNMQTFKIAIPELNEIILHVPISVAPKFKENWNNKKIINKQFMLVDGSWELTSLKIEIPDIEKFIEYNSNLSYSYNPVNQFSFELEPIKIDFANVDFKTPEDDLLAIKYDIKTNLPKTNMNKPDAIAIVIGNSNYKYTTTVDYAINDAQLMKTYLINVLGYKPANVFFLKDASKADFEGYFGTKDNYKGRLYKYLKEGISDVFVFYSGHGAPGIGDQKGYFVPIDCDPLYIELQGFQTDILYNNLAQLSAKSVTIVVDACFSGVGVLDNISSIIPKIQDPIFQIPDGVLISSSANDEVASWLKQQQNGLFTYFFLKAIHDKESSDIDNDNLLTYEELFKYISDKTNGVPYFARRLNDIQQNPYFKGKSEKVFINYISE